MSTIDHTKNVIEIKNLSFSYADDPVVKQVSLCLHKGDYLGVVGPNGGGKSTLLKLMLGLLPPSSGSIKIFDQEINNFTQWSKIGYVAQSKTIIDTSFPATVEEIVGMGRIAQKKLFQPFTSSDKQLIANALKAVDMYAYKDRLIGDLSGGQQQRVIIARALAGEPEIIFLDEPTVGVDTKTQKQFYELLRTLNKELHLTLILVSHELDVVAHEATELAYINRTLEYYGDPEEFLKGAYFHELIGKGGKHH